MSAKPKVGENRGNAGKGRPKGRPNKTTATLKEAILAGAAAVGQDGKGKDGLAGYCRYLAVDEPKAFAALLGRVLPLTVQGDKNNPVEHRHGIYHTDDQLHIIAAGGSPGTPEED